MYSIDKTVIAKLAVHVKVDVVLFSSIISAHVAKKKPRFWFKYNLPSIGQC